jgi:hypothetical protein
VKECSGFSWPEGTGGFPAKWTFTNNKVFGSRCFGIFVWQNSGNTVIENFESPDGVKHGAYNNLFEYRNLVTPTSWPMRRNGL